MRLILLLLAQANVRLATADLDRADRLRRDIDVAQESAMARLRTASALARRART